MIMNYFIIKGPSMDINLKCWLINLFFEDCTHLDMHLDMRFALNRCAGCDEPEQEHLEWLQMRYDASTGQ